MRATPKKLEQHPSTLSQNKKSMVVYSLTVAQNQSWSAASDGVAMAASRPPSTSEDCTRAIRPFVWRSSSCVVGAPIMDGLEGV